MYILTFSEVSLSPEKRLGKIADGETTKYMHEYDKVVLKVDGKRRQTARNVQVINLILRTVDGTTMYYLYNGYADVTELIDGSGNIRRTYYYDAFGNQLEITGTVNNPFTYAGYQYDSETGLYYLNARMYDPKTARFMQEDSYAGDLNDPLSLNLYTYCHNEPIMYIDPTGHVYVKASWVIDGPTTNTSENIKERMKEEKDPKKKGHLKDLYNYYAVSEEAYEDYEIDETEGMIINAFEDMVEGKLDQNTLIRGRAYGPMYILFHEKAQGKEYWEMTPKEIRDHHKVVQARLVFMLI